MKYTKFIAAMTAVGTTFSSGQTVFAKEKLYSGYEADDDRTDFDHTKSVPLAGADAYNRSQQGYGRAIPRRDTEKSPV